jgi:polysaccharide pyruvyl transferase WcaK-like protein
MGFCDPRRWPRKDVAVYHQHLDKLTALSRWLLAHDYRLEVFSSDILMDVLAIEDLKERLLGTASAHELANVVFCPIPTLKELLGQIASFDFVITSKYHGVIFSHMTGKPVIALSYLQKIEDLMRAVGHDHYCLDIEHCDTGTLIERFQSLVDSEDHLKGLFQRTSMLYADALCVDFDRLFGKEAISSLGLGESKVAGVVA